MSTPDAAREPLLRDESPRARATGPPLWLSLLVALAFAAFAAVVAAGVGMRAANPAEALVDPTAANPADALVDPTATTASEGALDASHRPALASRVRPHRHGHVHAFLGRDDRDDHDHHRRRRQKSRPDESSEEAPVSSEVSLPISDPAIPTPTTVDLPGRDIPCAERPRSLRFAPRARAPTTAIGAVDAPPSSARARSRSDGPTRTTSSPRAARAEHPTSGRSRTRASSPTRFVSSSAHPRMDPITAASRSTSIPCARPSIISSATSSPPRPRSWSGSPPG